MKVKGKFKGRKGKVIGITCLSLLGAFVVTLGSLYAYGITYRPEAPVEKIDKKSKYFTTYKNGVYDQNGNLFEIKGINIGNMFVQEGWLTPFALTPLKNDDGTLVKDQDGNIQYPEFTEMEFREALLNNPNCGKDNIDEWLDYYYDAWFNDLDFENIVDVGFNSIRVPFYWENILDQNFNRKSEEVAFKYLDKILEGAKKHNIYVILDLHGAPGSQNGYEHSGSPIKEANLWYTPEYVDATIDTWDYISEYYTTKRQDLSTQILCYDLLNEPTEVYGSGCGKICWEVFDKIYDKIRENNDEHIICMEGSWDFSGLPNPETYGWKNVMYQYHFYNWRNNFLPYNLFWAYMQLTNIGRQYEVPVYIGEFSFFHDKEQWMKQLDYFEEMHFGWSIWTYKMCVTGNWDNSWGIKVIKLNHDTSKEETKTIVSNCTFEEFKATCDVCRTTSKDGEFLKETISEYLRK